jgi:16S rRNA (cytidine1402-2'-O)-methyltransferase
MSRPQPEAPTQPALAPGLYIVASPIGNLGDLSARAADWLRRVDVVACEDTRVTAKLLRAAGSARPMLRFDDHAAPRDVERLVARMARDSVALVSDAGTPLVSDPGFVLVRAAQQAGIPVTTAPGPCAAIAALSVAGLPADRFFFAGFLPPRAAAREKALRALVAVPGTLIFHEAPQRLAESLAAMAASFGNREAAVVRELTKLHEEVRRGRLLDLAHHYAAQAPRGEIIVLVAPGEDPAADVGAVEEALARALESMPAGKAAASVAAAFGVPRKDLYARALELRRS